VPLIDGGTVRLPRLIGHGRAMDLILTGRAVGAEEALQIGLASRVCEDGCAREQAEALALELAAFPQATMRSDRMSAIEQWGMSERQALCNEFAHGTAVLGDAKEGARRFAGGAGRGGAFPAAGPSKI
jgi:enoyl-CoA hydratase